MKKRIITGIVMAIILLPLVVVEALFPLFQIVILGFLVIATFEMINMCEKKKKMSIPIKVLIIFLTILTYFGIINQDPACASSLIATLLNKIHFDLSIFTSLLIMAAFIFAAQIFVKDFETSDVGTAFMIIFYVSLGFASITILLFNGLRFIVYLLMVSLLTDIFALVFGLKFGQHGRHRLAPNISPKKSWEGAIGGTIVGTVLGSLFAIFYDQFGHFFVSGGTSINFFEGVFNVEAIPEYARVILIILLSLVISIFSQVGDLIASKFKRTYDIKDFSQVFPGHGGVLDRFDSALFGSIVFLCFIMIVRMIVPLV